MGTSVSMLLAWLVTQPRSMDSGKPSFQVIFEKHTWFNEHSVRSLLDVSNDRFQQSSALSSPESL